MKTSARNCSFTGSPSGGVQSILKRAFEGKLVPQNPDGEPASILLERIRADRRIAKANSQMYRQGDKTKRKPSHRRVRKINAEEKEVV